MNKCTFCGREAEADTREVGGYTILDVCTDCEFEIQREQKDAFLLFPESIRKSIPKLYETEQVPLNDKVVVMKLFCAGLTWYMIEGQQEADNYLFWAFVENHNDPMCSEFGYVSLNELEEFNKTHFYPKIERDLYFEPATISKIRNKKF